MAEGAPAKEGEERGGPAEGAEEETEAEESEDYDAEEGGEEEDAADFEEDAPEPAEAPEEEETPAKGKGIGKGKGKDNTKGKNVAAKGANNKGTKGAKNAVERAAKALAQVFGKKGAGKEQQAKGQQKNRGNAQAPKNGKRWQAGSLGEVVDCFSSYSMVHMLRLMVLMS